MSEEPTPQLLAPVNSPSFARDMLLLKSAIILAVISALVGGAVSIITAWKTSGEVTKNTQVLEKQGATVETIEINTNDRLSRIQEKLDEALKKISDDKDETIKDLRHD